MPQDSKAEDHGLDVLLKGHEDFLAAMPADKLKNARQPWIRWEFRSLNCEWPDCGCSIERIEEPGPDMKAYASEIRVIDCRYTRASKAVAAKLLARNRRLLGCDLAWDRDHAPG